MSERRTPPIALFDPAPAIARDRAALVAAFEAVLDSGRFVLGPAVASFEQKLRGWLGGEGEVVAVASGSDALELGLRALGVGAGQGVITTAYSFVATAEAIVHAGARPVFADVGPDGLLDLDSLGAQLARLDRTPTGQPRLPDGTVLTALVPVHLFGAVLDGEALARLAGAFHLHVLEDAAQALGGWSGERAAGTLGDAGAFSFFPSKTLGAFGDGGAVWVRDPAVARRLTALRQHGQPDRAQGPGEAGRNSRLDAVQAALLAVKLDRLADDIGERRRQLARYREGLAGTGGAVALVQPAEAGHAGQQAVVRCEWRDALAAWLAASDVTTAIYYREPLHRLIPYSQAPRLGSLARAEELARTTLALPLYPGLPIEQVDEVVARVVAFVREGQPTTGDGRGGAR